MYSTTHGSSARAEPPTRPAVMVAQEALLLWPRGVARQPTTVDEAGLWPVFVMVLADRTSAEASTATPLFELLNGSGSSTDVTVVTGQCRWTVLDPRNVLLRLAIRASAPVPFEVEVILPAQNVLGILDVVASGATIGITTSRRVGRLTGRIDIGDALREVVLLNCPPSGELLALSDSLYRDREAVH